MLQNDICPSCKIGGFRKSGRFGNLDIIEGYMAILNGSQREFVFDDFGRHPWPAVFDNESFNIFGLLISRPDDQNISIPVAYPSFVAVQFIPVSTLRD